MSIMQRLSGGGNKVVHTQNFCFIVLGNITWRENCETTRLKLRDN